MTLSPEGRRTRNLRVAESFNEQSWASAFLAAFREKRLIGFDIPAESNLITEIDALYRLSPEAVRTRMKAGATKAVGEYTARGYSSDVLRGLAWVASTTRATDAVPDLASHVIALHPELGRDDTQAFQVASDLLTALGSFARHTRVANLFRSLLFDDAVHFRFAGTLAVGLVRADPMEFVPAMNRFCERRLHGPEFFHDRTFMRAVFKAVLPADVSRHLEQLNESARKFVMMWAKTFSALPPTFQADDPHYDADGPAPHKSFESYEVLKDAWGIEAPLRGSVKPLYRLQRLGFA